MGGLAEITKKVNKAKAQYHSLTSAAKTLIYNIESNDEAWGWAHNDQNMGSLKKHIEDVFGMLDAGDREILVTDIALMKAEVGPETLFNRFGHFCQINEPLNLLAKKYKQIMAMYRNAKRGS